METTIYGLYHNEKFFHLEIKPFKQGELFDGIKKHNEFYYLSCERKLLREKAQEIKTSWISKREIELEKLKTIKIKNRYKRPQ